MTVTTEKIQINKKDIHNEYGIDWQRTDLITTYKHTGNFTIKSIVKEFSLSNEDLNFIFVKYEGNYRDTLDGVILTGDNLDKFELLSRGFYSKKNFDEVRKQEDIEVYVIVVKKEAIRQVKRYESSLWNLTRFADVGTRFFYYPKKHALFLNGHKWGVYMERLSVEEALDKSGYPVLSKRRQLQIKAEEIEKRNLEKVRYTHFNKDNALLKERISNLKNVLAEKLKGTANYKELDRVVDLMRDLAYIVGYFEGHTTKLLSPNKEDCYTQYGSIQDVNKIIKELNRRLSEEIEEKIKELG